MHCGLELGELIGPTRTIGPVCPEPVLGTHAFHLKTAWPYRSVLTNGKRSKSFTARLQACILMAIALPTFLLTPINFFSWICLLFFPVLAWDGEREGMVVHFCVYKVQHVLYNYCWFFFHFRKCHCLTCVKKSTFAKKLECL